ncbi:MAG: acyl-CoA dehydrogenase [Planctomycetota bacterium]|jgi:acyl-CoA dehydrogenase
MITLILLLAGFLALGFFSVPLLGWTAWCAVFLLWWGTPLWIWIVMAIPAVIFNVHALRVRLVSTPVMRFLKKAGILPVISKTEREALDAGTVWFEGELFSGKPDFERLLAEAYPGLSDEERAFLDGPCEEVCALTDDWEVFQKRDLPPQAWTYLREEGFFGMIIPKKYGGLEFSATAVSAVIKKLSSRSIPLGITAMLPNSLGPAELLMHYGTEEQKERLLPRLAAGKEVPCFALTEPHAGSDAGGIRAHGVVFTDEDGEIRIRMQLEKRYITLASRSTLLGVAFKLSDPENLLRRGTDLGICCALVPSDTPGLELGRQHDPLNVPFFNCPFSGKDVVIGTDDLVGGPERVGQGWRMLMEQLAAGRGIMLPASATAGVQAAARVTGAYTVVRKQFGMSIGKFEGIEEPMAYIGGMAYTLEAARRFTCGGLDGGAKPAVTSAIAKYNFTETMRDVVNDAMDILGGSGISRGPRNLMAHAYFSAPISITVEGANILTRTLMIFGQGAIRCHPFAENEISALDRGDVKGFDFAFFGHIGHVVRNLSRSMVLSVSRGHASGQPIEGIMRRDFQKVSWSSARFAILADIAMGTLGGDLKRKEILTGRFSDVFSWMYMASAVMRRYQEEGRTKEDYALYRWSMDFAFARIQEAFEGIYSNFDAPGLGWLFRGPLSLWARLNPIGTGPRDKDGQRIARIMQTPGKLRDRLTNGLYLPKDPEQAMGRMERAFLACVAADEVLAKVKKAIRDKKLPRKKPQSQLAEAQELGIITAGEVALVAHAEELREDAIQVDSFTEEEYLATAYGGGWEMG